MRKSFISRMGMLLLLLLTLSCAGVPLLFIDFRLGEFPVESHRTKSNTDCMSLESLNAIARRLEIQHLIYIRSRNIKDAIKVSEFLTAVEGCRQGINKLSVAEIKTELFGDVQTISNSSKLRELGGLSLKYTDVATTSEIETTLHIRSSSSGPEHRMVIIYQLADNKVIHYNYSGVDDVNRSKRSWPIDLFLKTLIGVASGYAAP